MKSMEHGPQPHPRLGEQGQVWAETVAESRVFAWRRYAQLMCGWSKGVLVRSYDSDEPYLMFRTLTKVLWKLDIMHHQWCKQLALLNIKFILSLWIFSVPITRPCFPRHGCWHRYPQTKGRVEYVNMGTPLDTNFYLGKNLGEKGYYWGCRIFGQKIGITWYNMV